jgi:hypothetical protein
VSALMAVPYLACMALVASLYHLPPRVLPAIQGVEGGSVGLVRLNTDGSEDLGVMQVNTRWVGPLSRYSGLDRAVVRSRLLAEPCFNIAAAGLILQTYLVETRGDLMRAVGNYHSHTSPRNAAYQTRVVQSASALFGPKPAARRRHPARLREARAF